MSKFSFNTIKNFDEHIELSIPNYKHLNELIASISTYFVKEDSSVYDLGCSTGTLLKEIKHFNRELKSVEYIGYDNSNNLLPTTVTENDNIVFINQDINNPKLPLDNSSLVLSIFTLQFLSIEERWVLCKKVYDHLKPGGAFIIAEKVILKDGFMQDLFTFSYYDYKKKSFSEKEILDKQTDLRAIMRPQTNDQNKIMFREAGFNNIETFFTSLFFKGWVLIK